jgi:MFS family permease
MPRDDPRARAAFTRLASAAFLAYCSYAMCRVPLLPLYARELGADAQSIGLIMAASTLTGVLVKLPAGAWSDVVGRRRLLAAGAFVFACLPFAYLAVSGLAALVLLRVVHGSATAIFGPVATASLSDVAPASRRGAWLSAYSTVQGLGQTAGPVLAGALIAAGRFDLAFVAAGLIGLPAPFIVAGWRQGPDPAPSPARWKGFRQGVSEVVQDRRVLITSLAQAAQFMLNGTLNAFLPLFGREAIGLSALELGWLFGLQTLTTLAVRPVLGRISDRAGRRGVIVAGLAVCSTAVLLISIAGTPRALVAAVVLYAAGVATTTAATSAYVTDITRRARYGAAHGVFGTIYDVGDAFGPIAAGMLVAWVGYARMFQVMALAAAAMALAFAVGTRGAAAPAHPSD